jgi:hypothetical protein
MASARGDRKPCTHAECSGTMQFGREPLLQVPPGMPPHGERGWACDESPAHFQFSSEGEQPGGAASPATQPRWDDDGGSTPGKQTIGSAEAE